MYFDRTQSEKSSLPAAAKIIRKTDCEDSAASDEAFEFRLSKNLGAAQTRRDKDQSEESLPVVETGKVGFAEKKAA